MEANCKWCGNLFSLDRRKSFCQKECGIRYYSKKLAQSEKKPQQVIVDLEGEIWKDVDGYEGLYMVSNIGRIKSLSRLVKTKRRYSNNNPNQTYSVPEKILKTTLSLGYMVAALTKDGKHNSAMVHRIIAKAFIPNPNSKPFINHINGIGSDNRIENLEWCTQKENIAHAISTGLSKNTGKWSVAVLDTVNGTIYNSISVAAEVIGITQPHLSAMLNGKMKNTTTFVRYGRYTKIGDSDIIIKSET